MMATEEKITTKELSLEREYQNSSSSSREKDFLLGVWGKGKEGFYTGETLSAGYERVYNFARNMIPPTVFEMVELHRYKIVLDVIEVQKVYHISGLVRRFQEQGITRYKVERVQDILVERGLLLPIPITGRAKSTIGLILYITRDCKQDQVHDYLRGFNAMDDLRYKKQLQREKRRVTPQEVVDHNKEVHRLSSTIPKVEYCDYKGDRVEAHKLYCKKVHA
jgi:hypothetical protein